MRTDNSTAVAYINNMGGIKYLACNEVAVEIWNICIANNNFLLAEHLPVTSNLVADKASREFIDDIEWTLDTSVFEKLQTEFGPFDIDLFASRLNAKVQTFVSWKSDPSATFC